MFQVLKHKGRSMGSNFCATPLSDPTWGVFIQGEEAKQAGKGGKGWWWWASTVGFMEMD